MTCAFTPLDSTPHRRHGWRKPEGYRFALADAHAPVLLAELSQVLSIYPLAFTPAPAGGYQVVAVQGLHLGENLFVDDAGRWRSTYIPSHYRAYPFALVQVRHEDRTLYMLGFDQRSGLYRETPDPQRKEERFFDDQGDVTPWMKNMATFLTEIARNRDLTHAAVAALVAAKLLEPWELSPPDAASTGSPPAQLYRISAAALKGLPGSVLEILRDTQALDLAYAQLLSMPRVGTLHRLAQLHQARAATGVPDARVVQEFYDPDQSDTLHFNW